MRKYSSLSFLARGLGLRLDQTPHRHNKNFHMLHMGKQCGAVLLGHVPCRASVALLSHLGTAHSCQVPSCHSSNLQDIDQYLRLHCSLMPAMMPPKRRSAAGSTTALAKDFKHSCTIK